MRRADHVHEALDALHRIREAETRRRHGEARAVGGEAQVAGQRHRHAAAEAEAVDHRDHRLRRGADGAPGATGEPIVFDRRAGIGAQGAKLADVGAGDERLLPGPAQDDDADLAVGAPARRAPSASPSHTSALSALCAAGRLTVTQASGGSRLSSRESRCASTRRGLNQVAPATPASTRSRDSVVVDAAIAALDMPTSPVAPTTHDFASESVVRCLPALLRDIVRMRGDACGRHALRHSARQRLRPPAVPPARRRARRHSAEPAPPPPLRRPPPTPLPAAMTASSSSARWRTCGRSPHGARSRVAPLPPAPAAARGHRSRRRGAGGAVGSGHRRRTIRHRRQRRVHRGRGRGPRPPPGAPPARRRFRLPEPSRSARHDGRAGARGGRRLPRPRAHQSGQRCVLIVHGRGLNSKDQVPVLKHRLTTWLTRGSWARLVLAFTSARPCDGGAGALYVLLRRQPRVEAADPCDRGSEVVAERGPLPVAPLSVVGRALRVANRKADYGNGNRTRSSPLGAAEQRLDAEPDPPIDAERLAPAAEIESLRRARAPPCAARRRRSGRRHRRRPERRGCPRVPGAA